MTDKRSHRGMAPEDQRLFCPEARTDLRRAVEDMSWLLSRGYADKSSLKLVCDRFALTRRQRLAVMRSACSDQDLELRAGKELLPAALRGKRLLVDGYNIITCIETALGGGVIMRARDGSYRDIAGVHGTYRKVEETVPAVKLIGQALVELSVDHCHWYLDSPVSNSGRLRKTILHIAAENEWDWQVDVVTNPDDILSQSPEIIASGDSIILNRCTKWLNLAGWIITRHLPHTFLVDLCTK